MFILDKESQDEHIIVLFWNNKCNDMETQFLRVSRQFNRFLQVSAWEQVRSIIFGSDNNPSVMTLHLYLLIPYNSSLGLAITTLLRAVSYVHILDFLLFTIDLMIFHHQLFVIWGFKNPRMVYKPSRHGTSLRSIDVAGYFWSFPIRIWIRLILLNIFFYSAV